MANIEQAITDKEIDHSEVMLIVPRNGNEIHLREFMEKVNRRFGTRILRTAASWTEIFITLGSDKPLTIANMLDQLVNMREVEKAEETEIMTEQVKQYGILVKLTTQ